MPPAHGAGDLIWNVVGVEGDDGDVQARLAFVGALHPVVLMPADRAMA